MTGARRRLAIGIGLVISAVAIWVVLGSVHIDDAVDVLMTANLVPVMAILGAVAVQVVIRAWRWSILLPRDGDDRAVGPDRLVGPMLVGYLGNAVLPARLGEPMRAVIVSRRERVGTTEALGSVLVERIVDVATLAVVAFAASLLVEAPSWSRQALGVAAAVGVAGIAFLVTIGFEPVLRLGDRLGLERRPRLRDVMARLTATLGGPSRRSPLLAAAGISVAAWLLDAVSFWLAGQAVGAHLSYGAALLVAGVTVLGTAIPSAPGYVGTFELAAAGTAQALGVPGPEAVGLAVVAHVMTLVPTAAAGGLALTFMGSNLSDVAGAAERERLPL